MIKVFCSHPNIVSVTVSDTMGGQQLNVDVMPDILDTIQWVQQHKAQLAHEQQMRQNNPDLQELYLSYQTALNLISK